MPGIVGFTAAAAPRDHAGRVLQTMQDMITHADFYQRDPLWSDDSVWATRSVTGVIKPEPQPHSQEGVHVWMNGTIYNGDEVAATRGLPGGLDDLALMAALYKQDSDFGFLRQLDGFYTAVVYDAGLCTVSLMTDRFGLRYLYWSIVNGGLVWGSETKVVLALPGYKPRVNSQAAKELVRAGTIFEDHCLFDGVHLLAPGTVQTHDLNTREVRSHQYWWWTDLPPVNHRMDVREAAEEMGRLFCPAVERASAEPRINLELSGGLDSRAIFAAIPDGHEIHAYTAGRHGCDDILIAGKVVRRRPGAAHHIFEIDGTEWVTPPTVHEIWEQDGHVTLLQIIGSVPKQANREENFLRLNGLGGDTLLGGTYLTPHTLDKPITREAISGFVRSRPDPDTFVNVERFGHLPKVDFYLIENRLRRMQVSGIRRSLTLGEMRMPFMDYALVDFSLSMPDRLRLESYAYRHMLLDVFPQYYRDIPWQKKGGLIDRSDPLSRQAQLQKKLARIVKKYKAKLGRREALQIGKSMTDRATWIRTEPMRSFFEGVLMNPDALYPDFHLREQVMQEWTAHFAGENRSPQLCHIMTLEIWLREAGL